MTESTHLLDDLDLMQLQVLADSLVRCLPDQLTIGLIGTLGAGKTTFTQSVSRAFGIDASDVTSPTFTLLQSYRVEDRTLHHLDAYRIADEDEFLDLGVEELFEEPRAWTLIEWADRVQDVLPTETLWIEIELDDDPGRRRVRLKTSNQDLATALATALRKSNRSGEAAGPP